MWKYSNETLITHPDRTFDPPIPPGYEVEVRPGDGVELLLDRRLLLNRLMSTPHLMEQLLKLVVVRQSLVGHSHRLKSWTIYNLPT